MLTGHTRTAGVIGHPVAHSLSPALHNAGFASLGADWVYVAFDVAEGAAVEALAAMRVLGLGGLSVTMPHKADVAGAVDRLDDAAAALRSVNTVSVASDGALVGHSTDGQGLVESLVAVDAEPGAGYSVCVLGAGGAARSIVDAFGRRATKEVIVVNRTPSRATACAALAANGRVGSDDDIRAADVVINATSIGMSGSASATPLPCDPSLLRSGQVVVDIVYHPLRTPLLAAAEAAGCRVIDGLGMLVHQAALQQQIWLGMLPDVGAMRAAAMAELARRT